jgi:predicted Fe-S protein YdhL (DUF1289 family)
MNIIREVFDQTRPIDRQITSVINYAGATEDQLEREIREYEVTDSLARHYERLLNNLADGFAAGAGHEIGVWVSGFYGSGKSSFTKYLGFAFDPKRKLKGEPFLKSLQNQFPSIQLRQQLSVVANKFPATVIMLDLAAVASVQAAAQGVSRLLYDEVMAWAGYSKDEKLALLELLLEKDGKLAKFKARFQEVAKGRAWDSLKNDLLLGVTFASRIVSEFYPDIWPDAKSFNDTKISARYGEDERVKQMLDLVERRSGNRRVIFIIDEVGQFLEGSPQLILNMQGLAENLKNSGLGQAWVIATAQQTLPVTGPLFKLKDRFPEGRRVDIESSDIREITYRRLLRKSKAGDKLLQSLFKQKEGAILHATQLKNTKLFQSTLTADAFVKLYPFLPQHFSLLMELLRSLARSTGGIGLRSAIKVIQDVLVDVSGYRSGHKLLADANIGALATADVFYDTLRRDIERANRQLVETVDRVSEVFNPDSLHLRVAKTIVVLQFIDGFPVSRENVAALLYPNLKSGPVTAPVDQVINEMLAEKGLPLTEIDGSLRFMSEAVSQIMGEKSLLQPSSSDSNRILSERLGEILSPEPSALVEGTLKVKVQTKLVQGSMPIAIPRPVQSAHHLHHRGGQRANTRPHQGNLSMRGNPFAPPHRGGGKGSGRFRPCSGPAGRDPQTRSGHRAPECVPQRNVCFPGQTPGRRHARHGVARRLQVPGADGCRRCFPPLQGRARKRGCQSRRAAFANQRPFHHRLRRGPAQLGAEERPCYAHQ